MLTIVGTVVSLVGGWVTEWLGGKINAVKTEARIKEAEAEARISIAEKKVMAEIDWDIKAVDQLQTSWKDEYLTILLTIPLILAFIPGMDVVVMSGFEILATKVPEWYMYLVGGVVASGLGLRKLTNLLDRVKK